MVGQRRDAETVHRDHWIVAAAFRACARQHRGRLGDPTAAPLRDGAQQDLMEDLLEARVRPFVDEHYWLPLYSMGSLAVPGERSIGYTPTAPGNIGRADAPVPSLPCWAAFTEGHILADGRFSACCFDAKGDWIMG